MGHVATLGQTVCTNAFMGLTVEVMICSMLAQARLVCLAKPWFALEVLVSNQILFVITSVTLSMRPADFVHARDVRQIDCAPLHLIQ